MDAKELGTQRQNAHPNGTRRFFADPNEEDRIGIAGEIAFAKKFGLQVDTSIRPEGDDHVDFQTSIGTIDVKTARKPYHLLIKEWEIEKCADFIVLAQYKADDLIEFLGWETKNIMALMPVKDFGYGIRNYYRHQTQLRPMSQLETLLKVRVNVLDDL